MKRFFRFAFFVLLVLAALTFFTSTSADAGTENQPAGTTVYELINAVNDLRISQGLPPYAINSILMSVAQAQSDYQASIGSVTHYGPSGSRPYQRALDAGYPVAGDLSQGGFYSENIMGGTDLSAQSLVNAWSGDDLHLGTMTSPNLTEVGAGVACAGSFCYYTLDAAQPTGGTVAYTPGANSTPGGGPTSIVIFPNTPEADGSIHHTVQTGETLWIIAQAYGVSVDDITHLNHISSNLIYVGDVLLIRAAAAIPTVTEIPTETPAPTFTPFVFWTVTITPQATLSQPALSPVNGAAGNLIVVIIIVAAFVLAGVLTAASARKKKI